MTTDFASLVCDFRKAAHLAGISLPDEAIEVQCLPAPHKPPAAMPKGKFAVYVFMLNGRCLKVGKAGPKSHARYCNQHYNHASSLSNLSKSLLANREEFALHELPEGEIGSWIKANTERVNIVLDATCGISVLTLLEAFVQCRLSPYFEGFQSQCPQ